MDMGSLDAGISLPQLMVTKPWLLCSLIESPLRTTDPIHVFGRIWILLRITPGWIPWFCSSKVPWEVLCSEGSRICLQSPQQRPPATPRQHHHHKGDRREPSPGAAPPNPACWRFPLDSNAKHRSCQPKPLFPALSLPQNSLLEQRASPGISVWAWAGTEGGRHKEQHLGQEMGKRASLPESREQPPAKGAAGVSQRCRTLHKPFTLLKQGEKPPSENSVHSQSSTRRGTGNQVCSGEWERQAHIPPISAPSHSATGLSS